MTPFDPQVSLVSRLRAGIAARGSSYAMAGVVLMLAAASHACSKDPHEMASAHVASGDAYLAKGKFKEAIIEYRGAIKAQPKWSEAHYKLAKAYTQANDPEKA